MKSAEIYDLNIVLVGDLNPVIIQPFWLAHKGLIMEIEGEKAVVDVIHNEIVRYRLDWATIEITRKRFSIRTSKVDYFDASRDLAVSIFTILNETPLEKLGINHTFHFKTKDKDQYLNIRNVLTPMSNWEDVLEDPKVLLLDLIEQKRRDGLDGHYRVRISPSGAIPINGISININDHFDALEKKNSSRYLINLLGESWGISFDRASETYSKLWEKLNI